MCVWQARCFRYPFTLSHAHDHHAMVLLSFATNTAHHRASQHITILNMMLNFLYKKLGAVQPITLLHLKKCQNKKGKVHSKKGNI